MPLQDQVIHRLKAALDSGEAVGMATVVGLSGSIPTDVGSRLLVNAEGQLLAGTVGGGQLEAIVIHRLVRAIAERRSPYLDEHHLTDDEAATLGMTCGGSVQLFCEPFNTAPEVLLVGAGHVNQALAKLLVPLEFQVTVVDDRPEWCRAEYFPPGVHLRVVDSLQAPFGGLSRSEGCLMVVATRCHATDGLVLRAALGRPWRYVGLIGSRTKVAKLLAQLEGLEGFPLLQASLRGPVGLDLGGKTPAAVALSIAAELQAVRHGRTALPLSRGQGTGGLMEGMAGLEGGPAVP